MADESESVGARRVMPAPPPRHPNRHSLELHTSAPTPRPRTRLPVPDNTQQTPPRLIRPSEHLAIVERGMERRAPHLVPNVTVVCGPRRMPAPILPPPPPAHRSVIPPPTRMPAPVSRLPQPRRDISQVSHYF